MDSPSNSDTCNQIWAPNHWVKLYHAIEEMTSNMLSLESKLSPQMNARLSRLSKIVRSNQSEQLSGHVVRCLSSIMNRLMLELVQAHFCTKQREHDFRSLLIRKGCLLDPILIKSVIDELINLYQSAAKHCSECSFTRKVLILYLQKTFDNKFREKDLAGTIQTLYRSSCFESRDGKLKLRDGITAVEDVRARVNTEMIKLGLDNNIRLNPESWSFILYGVAEYQENIPRIQSLLDKLDTPVEIEELKNAIDMRSDHLKLRSHMDELDSIRCDLHRLQKHSVTIDSDQVCNLIKKLSRFKRLFVVRQSRGVKV